METKREKIVVRILIGIVIVLWFIQQYLTNQLYDQTPQFVNNQEMIQKFAQINNDLTLELLSLKSYTRIEQIAIKEGFVKAPIIYLQ